MLINARFFNILQTYKDKDLEFELFMNDGSKMQGNAVKLKVAGNQENVRLTDKGGLFELLFPLNNIDHYLISIDKEKDEEVLVLKTNTYTLRLFLNVTSPQIEEDILSSNDYVIFE